MCNNKSLFKTKDLGRLNDILNICTIIIRKEFLKYHVLIIIIQIDKYKTHFKQLKSATLIVCIFDTFNRIHEHLFLVKECKIKNLKLFHMVNL